MNNQNLIFLIILLLNSAFMLYLVYKSKNGKVVDIERILREELDGVKKDQQSSSKDARQELVHNLQSSRDSIEKRLDALRDKNDEKFELVRVTLQRQLEGLQKDNSEKLEKMRATVDEKLQSTLEKRLGESFKLVSDRLEQVHKGLGEMQGLATSVSDFKRVLTNVKTRGTWGEVQLESLLDQVFIKDHYAKQVALNPDSRDTVDFVIMLPDKSSKTGNILLPIDAKFPLEDYQRLVTAQEAGDIDLVNEAAKALANRVKLEAKSIKEKYIQPPKTTDFAILYVPTEGLYAEVLRYPGLFEKLQSEYRVTVAGPTTIAAILSSYQLGFRTLAIAEQTSQVWETLTTIKGEFGKFGDLLEKTRDKLVQATNTIDDASKKSRTIEGKLNKVEKLATKVQDKLVED
jgi:DNA recombination protein RmuC